MNEATLLRTQERRRDHNNRTGLACYWLDTLQDQCVSCGQESYLWPWTHSYTGCLGDVLHRTVGLCLDCRITAAGILDSLDRRES